MSEKLIRGKYTTIGPDEIWKIYNSLSGIFRAGGNSGSPRLIRADGPRRTDFRIIYDALTGIEMVHPDATKGLSFADSITTLASKKIEGWVWTIPKGAKIPEGLCFNIKDFDHPLLNVSKIMSVLDMTARLTQLADVMVACEVKINKIGTIEEKFPGALKKVAQQ
jgi:hypothetical protein